MYRERRKIRWKKLAWLSYAGFAAYSRHVELTIAVKLN